MSRLQVMISSRCLDPIPDGVGGKQSLSDVRHAIKEDIEKVLADGKAQAFDVWICEDADPAAAVIDSWDACMQQAKTCDIFIALYNGHSGWAPPGSSVGICQAELQTAVDAAPEKCGS